MTEERCLNCDETVTGNYCQHCGQPVKTPRGPVFNALMTFLDEFNLDHKFFTSLKSLFIAPGALTKLFADAGLLLVDYKLEFGRFNGEIYLGDEFTPDGCRLWDAETRKNAGKDRFRQGLGGVVEAYEEVAHRLGVDLD